MDTEIGVVILNYLREELTIRCVKSLSRQVDVRMHIVIVDNASEEKEYLRLISGLEKLHVNHCDVVRSPENLGFARGMNLGIEYLRRFSVSYIFLANSDLVFDDPDTMKILLSLSISMTNSPDSRIALINPLVVNPDGKVQSGIQFSKSLTRLHMWKTQFPWIDRILRRFRTLRRKSCTGSTQGKELTDGPMTTSPQGKTNPSLSRVEKGSVDDRYRVVGCGFVLTPAFFRHYPGLFSETFLYNEEYTTILLMKSAGLQTMSVNTPPILHIHGASTSAAEKNTAAFQRRIRSGNRAFLRLLLTPDAVIRKRYDISLRNDSGV
jgi:GT2 family glycosyltransferase